MAERIDDNNFIVQQGRVYEPDLGGSNGRLLNDGELAYMILTPRGHKQLLRDQDLALRNFAKQMGLEMSTTEMLRTEKFAAVDMQDQMGDRSN